MPRPKPNPPPDFVREVESRIGRSDVGTASWAGLLSELATHNGAHCVRSSLADGAAATLAAGHQSGNGRIEPYSTSGLHMVALGRQGAAINWTMPALDGETAVLHLLVDLSSNIEHNFYVAFGRDGARTVRLSNTSVTWVETASVLQIDRAVTLLTLVLSPEFVSLFVNGSLRLRKAHRAPIAGDSLALELVAHEAADLGAVICAFEVWSQQGELAGLGHADAATLQRELAGYIDDGDLPAVCNFLALFDSASLAPLSEQALHLLDASLEPNKRYPDWAVEQVLAALPDLVADAWREKNAARIPIAYFEVENVSARLYRNPATKWSPGNLLGYRKAETFMALSDVSFKVFPGDTLGVIGANGAGKSTLLRVINGLIPIETGSITLRAAPLLLSPGLGIRDELSGRRNILLACCFMGLSQKQAEALYEDIVQFSELGPFIDRPFKYYSDGMKSRLVFSIATAVAPDIIMLDELLNAGDIGFQQKAARRMEQLIERAKAVVVVTHSIPFVLERCNKALLIGAGRQVAYGEPRIVVARYLDLLQVSKSASGSTAALKGSG